MAWLGLGLNLLRLGLSLARLELGWTGLGGGPTRSDKQAAFVAKICQNFLKNVTKPGCPFGGRPGGAHFRHALYICIRPRQKKARAPETGFGNEFCQKWQFFSNFGLREKTAVWGCLERLETACCSVRQRNVVIGSEYNA